MDVAALGGGGGATLVPHVHSVNPSTGGAVASD
jgi:hypothetical protein